MSNKLIKKRQKKKLYIKRRLVYFVAMPLILLALLFYILNRNFIINITDSMPIGLYKKLPTNRLEIGSIVSVCLDNQKAKLAEKNNLITKNNQCLNGSQMLVKEIIGVPGDTVEITNDKIKDHHGKMIYIYTAPRFAFSPRTYHPVLTFISTGNYKLTGYWLYGEYDYENSWDSRYFGQVSANNIINVLKPVWIWSNK